MRLLFSTLFARYNQSKRSCYSYFVFQVSWFSNDACPVVAEKWANFQKSQTWSEFKIAFHTVVRCVLGSASHEVHASLLPQLHLSIEPKWTCCQLVQSILHLSWSALTGALYHGRQTLTFLWLALICLLTVVWPKVVLTLLVSLRLKALLSELVVLALETLHLQAFSQFAIRSYCIGDLLTLKFSGSLGLVWPKLSPLLYHWHRWRQRFCSVFLFHWNSQQSHCLV